MDYTLDTIQDAQLLYDDVSRDGEDEYIAYGDNIKLWEGKAITLLADQLFSPALLLAEAIETGKITLEGRTVLELGAGTALPSLVAAAKGPDGPSLVTITDYPDPLILENLRKNVEGNRPFLCKTCCVECTGGQQSLVRELLPAGNRTGYDVLILSDLLHFRSSHDDLVNSISKLSQRAPSSRIYVAAGKYTHPEVCKNFLHQTRQSGIEWIQGENDGIWRGESKVGTWSTEDLGTRKSNVDWWIGSWETQDSA
ncbi:hypothetical protein FRB99_005232 [Tulasnella sp. 403]|nr:hypothetical protein FRB99_005232 [Tulasnella sp. 403]